MPEATAATPTAPQANPKHSWPASFTGTSATVPEDETVKSRYFTPAEVAQHHQRGDIWVSWLGHVYNLTPLVEQHFGDSRLLPIIHNAGKDISHWFDPATGDLQLCTDQRTGLRVPKCPDGIPVHVPNVTQPSASLSWEVETPWWLDARKYQVGRLSTRTRKVRIVNTLIGEETVLEICTEEPIKAIVDRYLKHNAHAKGYVWKYLGRVLDMSATFANNGIADESAEMERIGINELDWLPALFLYFADDLTVA